MPRITLRLQRADNMDLPSLAVEGLAFAPEEHAALERELRSRFGEITTSGEGGTFEARTRLRLLPTPARFRIVRVSRERSRRCPEVWLEAETGWVPHEPEDRPIRWERFREAARDLLNSIPESERASLDGIADEFCQLEQESPRNVLIILLTAYALLQHQLTEDVQKVRRAKMEDAIGTLARGSHHESLQGLARIGDGLGEIPTQLASPGKAKSSRRRIRGPEASAPPGGRVSADDDRPSSNRGQQDNGPMGAEPPEPT